MGAVTEEMGGGCDGRTISSSLDVMVSTKTKTIAFKKQTIVVAILVAIPGIIVSYQIAFGKAGGTSPGTSNVGGNGIPQTQPLKGGGSGPANDQGVCYGQGADTLVPGPSGNTQIPNQGPTAPHEQHTIRDANCPASPGAPSDY